MLNVNVLNKEIGLINRTKLNRVLLSEAFVLQIILRAILVLEKREKPADSSPSLCFEDILYYSITHGIRNKTEQRCTCAKNVLENEKHQKEEILQFSHQ